MAMNADLNAAADAGDIKGLYTQIENDPYILENSDKIPFVDTPLHVAASAGQVGFAIEIISLMPSFARKLNKQGLSPIHLALQNGHDSMVRRFVSINKELVRVKGREGLTPLHHAADNNKQTDILADLLAACLNSIEHLTVEGDTALHIAVKEGQFEGLQFLVDWLLRSSDDLRESILNRKNESGETILHPSTRKRDVEAVRFFIKSGINLNAKNLEGSTALDIVEMPGFANAEIKNMLVNAKAKRGTNVTDAPSPTLAKRQTSVADILRRLSAPKIDDKTSNALVAVAVLIATMTYQSALSPPGGVYQADASAASTNSNNSTFMVGKSVMSIAHFSEFSTFNTASLLMSTVVILTQVPSGFVCIPIIVAITYFWFGYEIALEIISPCPESNGFSHSMRIIRPCPTIENGFSLSQPRIYYELFCLWMLIYILFLVLNAPKIYASVSGRGNNKKETGSGENRWSVNLLVLC